MPHLALRTTLLTALLAAPAFAQTPPRSSFTEQSTSTVAPALPSPGLSENAAAVDFLRVAENALAGGRTGQAQEAMEMAQTRLLDRSVPLGQTDRPSDHPAVKLISQGLQALAAGDRATCLRMIQAAAAEAARQP